MRGERLRQARLLAGLNQEELAQALTAAGKPATKAVISKYERGKSTPKPTFMLELARILGVSPVYFMASEAATLEWIAFRKHADLAAAHQDTIRHYAADVAALQLELTALFAPARRTQFPERVAVQKVEEAEAIAEHLRMAWQLADHPIGDLCQTAEDQGVIIIGWKRGLNKFDGLAGRTSAGTPVIVLNTAVAADRRRFSLAHELGHFLMETPAALSEKAAHRFAAALLVPASRVYAELGRRRTTLSLEELAVLKRRYGLSIQGWIFRACDLEIITPHHATSLWKDISRRGWRKEEPVAFESHEEPLLLQQMIEHALAEGLLSRDRVRLAVPTYGMEAPAWEGTGPPSATQLLMMDESERAVWIERAFARAEHETFEIFEAFGEEAF